MSSFSQLELDVLRWADARGILKNGNVQTQMLKGVSEMGELCDAIIKRDRDAIIDSLGDCLVVLVIVADMESLDLLSCLESAYNEIKDRKGRLNANGVFEKEAQTKGINDATEAEWDAASKKHWRGM